jgi:hypothetical protein
LFASLVNGMDCKAMREIPIMDEDGPNYWSDLKN